MQEARSWCTVPGTLGVRGGAVRERPLASYCSKHAHGALRRLGSRDCEQSAVSKSCLSSVGEQCGCPVRKLNSGAPTEDRSGAAPIGPNAKCNDSPFCARSRVRPPKNAIENGVRGTVGDDLARAGTQ